MKYYRDLFETIKKYASQYKDLKKILLTLLYKLLLIDSKPISQCTHEKKRKQTIDSVLSSEQNQNVPQIDHHDDELNVEEMYQDEVFLGYIEEQFPLNKNFFQSEIPTDRCNTLEQHQFFSPQNIQNPSKIVPLPPRKRTRRGSIDMEKVEQKTQNIVQNVSNMSNGLRDTQFSFDLLTEQEIGHIQVEKVIPLGFVWAKLPYKSKWKRYYARCQDCCLLFCRDVNFNDFSSIYIIYNCEIQMMSYYIPEWDNNQHAILIFSHEFDNDCLLLAFEEYQQKFGLLLSQLRLKSMKNGIENMEEVEMSNRYSFGKIYLRINFFEDYINFGNIFIRIKLNPYILESKKIQYTELMRKFHLYQDFYIPIHNRYEQLVIQVVQYGTQGWVKSIKKEAVLEEFIIPLPFLKNAPFNQETLRFSLKHILDSKKKKSNETTLERITPKLEIILRDMSNIKTLIAFNPNKQVLENKPKKNDYTRREMSLVMSRTVLTKQMIEEIQVIEHLVFYYRYPRFSNFCMIFLIFFVCTFDSSYMLSYILFTLILIYIIHNHYWQHYIQPFLNKTLFSQVNPFFNESKTGYIRSGKQVQWDNHMKNLIQATTNGAQPQKQPSNEKKNKKLAKIQEVDKEEDESGDEIGDILGENNQEQEQYNFRQKGILQRYKSFKMSLANIAFFFDTFSDLVEKINTLLKWKDETSSLAFLIILLTIFLVVTFLPLRFFMVLGLLKKFNRGKTYYQRKWKGNREACLIELRNFMINQNIVKSQEKLKNDEEWLDKNWGQMLKQQKRVQMYMEDKLMLFLPKNFMSIYKTPRQLIDSVGYLNQILNLQPNEDNEQDLRKNMNLYRKKPNPIVYIYNFIMNNVSSMMYVLKNKNQLQKP